MMRHFILTASMFLALLAMVSCKKDPCLDLPKLEQLRQEMVSWYPDTTTTTFLVTDRNGISQSLAMYYYYFATDQVIEDDCGNTYGSFDFSAQYRTSVSPYNFYISIRGSGIPDDGFYININYDRYSDYWASRTAQYDLDTDQSRGSDAEITYFTGDSVYGDFIEVVFLNTIEPTEIERIWFSKGYGIFRFADKQGNIFDVSRPIPYRY